MKRKYIDDIEDVIDVESKLRPIKTIKLKSKFKPIKKHHTNTNYNYGKRS